MLDTKAKIIDWSYSLFVSHSYDTVTISDISKGLGLTKGALYYLFINKEELFKKVVDKYFVMNMPLTTSENSTFAELIKDSLAIVENSLSLLFNGKPDLTIINYMNFICDVFRHYPSFAEQKKVWLKQELIKVKYVLDNAIVTKEIRKDIDTQLVAINYLSIIEGMYSNIIYTGLLQEFSVEILQKQLQAFYKTLKI